MELSYISGNRNPQKNSCIFLKESFSCILGNRSPEDNSLYFRKRNFLTFREMKTSKNFLNFTRELLGSKTGKNTLKMFLIFWEMELSSTGLKKLLIFQERTCKA